MNKNANLVEVDVDDIKLKTLANIPISITKSITIYPLTLKEITTLGYDIYNKSLNYICIDLKDIEYNYQSLANITTLDFIINSCIQDANFKIMFLNALSLFLRSKMHFFDNKIYVNEILKENIITNDIFKSIQTIIKVQNSIEQKKEDGYNVKSKKGREILEKLKKGKEKLNKAKENLNLTLFDLVSIYCSYNNNTNLLDVWDYNMFQFNDQFQRIQILEQYDVNIQALLHGAKMEGENPTFIKKIN
ncbi:hypothetical protein ADU90_06405 (plasmid) [Clostridium botulinum]|uniref:Uncharacterized protein n=2 Tax=Clostridium botulinum TaxID=1491 RepID=A0A0A0HY79_CLOBO|nr:hypothetical protein [Clostridium botulinum]KEH96572.1 hypothetical protein Z953_p0152 [Clostridium botulinum D str. 16868]KGM93358.1 hypothetical protein Z955_15405 [Clostridium botulinum C/D str. DC5]KOC56959.1 hypothetical protein ADU89_01865 [Clostridium botulinum]KOC57434.1 hypothetical protein ADU90_06405 [Clostridium botulinum]MCD3232677.1 hypothetical protein [Clostridium botulinum D/C]